MVKAPKGTITRVGRQPTGQSAPREACPPLEFEVAVASGASVREGDPVSAQLRDGRVRLICEGQTVAWVDNRATMQSVTDCQEAGGRYEGRVGAVGADGAVILLEGHG